MIKVAASVIGLGLAMTVATYVISPALKRWATVWVEVGSTGSLRRSEPEELEYAGTVKDGWRTVARKKRFGPSSNQQARWHGMRRRCVRSGEGEMTSRDTLGNSSNNEHL